MKHILNYVKNTLIIIFNKQMSADLYEKFQHQLFILPLNFQKLIVGVSSHNLLFIINPLDLQESETLFLLGQEYIHQV